MASPPAGAVYGLVAVLQWIIDLLRNPGEIIAWGGYPALGLVVFLETGAMIFFLPGDSLLVMAGLYAAKGDLDIWALNGLLIPMAVMGDATSYWIGTRTGPHLFNRPRSRLFNPDHVRAAHQFYERHGGQAIILARFMPLVRTFVPVVAGIGGMSYRRFFTYNVVGATGWVASMKLIGYVLGSQFPLLVQHIEKVIVVVIFVSILPGLVEWFKAWRRGRAAPPAAPPSGR
jgi:membrane-associated protein